MFWHNEQGYQAKHVAHTQENKRTYTELMTVLGCKTSHKKRLTYMKITNFWAVTSYILVDNIKISG